MLSFWLQYFKLKLALTSPFILQWYQFKINKIVFYVLIQEAIIKLK